MNDDAVDVLTLLPEVDVRARLAGRPLALSMLLPPYPALGIGTLRVLRIDEGAERTHLVVGYDRYEPLDAAPPRQGAPS